jgi:hypothetical protein
VLTASMWGIWSQLSSDLCCLFLFKI